MMNSNNNNHHGATTGSSHLPLNPSLAAALALHGVHTSNNNPAEMNKHAQSKPKAIPTTSNANNSNNNSRKKTSIQALAVHPSLPRIAYMAEETILTEQPPPSKNKSSASSSSSRRQESMAVTTQRIVIQQYSPKQQQQQPQYAPPLSSFFNNTNNTAPASAPIATLAMEQLPSPLNKFRQYKSKSSKLSNNPLTLASLGPLQSISFLDREALFWMSRRRFGGLTNLDHVGYGSGGYGVEDRDIVIHGDTMFDSAEGGMGHGLCLGLQFTRALVVLRFEDNNNSNGSGGNGSSNPFVVLCCLEGQRTNFSSTTSGKPESSIQYTPTSAMVPISNSIIVYGCSDGAMRFHSLLPSMLYSSKFESLAAFSYTDSLSSLVLPSSSTGAGGAMKSAKQTRQATIKSVRGPNGRNDPVVKIIYVDPVYNDKEEVVVRIINPNSNGNTSTNEESITSSNATILVLRSRLLTVCASGVAYLWDVHLELDRASGSVRDLIVQPPLVRLDGLGSLTISPRKEPPRSPSRASLLKNSDGGGGKAVAHIGGFWGGIGGGSSGGSSGSGTTSKSSSSSKEGGEPFAKAPYHEVTPAVTYDPHRNLLIWVLPSGAPASSIDHRGDYKLESHAPNSSKAKKDQEDQLYFSKWASENGGFVKAWDFSMIDALLQTSAAAATSSSSPQPPPKFPPMAVMKLAPSSSAGSVHLTMIAGLSHTPIPTATLTCVSLSNDRTELQIQAIPLPSPAITADDQGWSQRSSIGSPAGAKSSKRGGSETEKAKILFSKATKYHSVLFAGALHKTNQATNAIRGSAVAASPFWPDTVAIATDHGVVMVNLAEGDSWASDVDGSLLGTNLKKRPSQAGAENKNVSVLSKSLSNVQTGPYHTIISGGPVGGVGNNRPGALFIEGHAVYASRLGTSRSSNNDRKQAFVERVDLPDPVLLCQLPGRSPPCSTTRSTNISCFVESHKPMRCPPRLIPSPSGRYLCLFWEREKMYEILHAGSLLAREQGNAFSATSLDGPYHGVTPSVDAGSPVISFAWVGDDDKFAILRPPSSSLIETTQNGLASSPRRSSSLVSPAPEARRDAIKSFFTPSLPNFPSEADGNNAGTPGADGIQISASSGSKEKPSRPQVELKKLAEAEVGAVELAAGASIAAATTVSLGSLSVRGGDRVNPSVLFGGPALCVGCLPVQDGSSHSNIGIDEGIAYFYSQKSGAIKDHDERASTYTTVGPSIPYPDLVSWDDDSRLCAISMGSRVAVYLSAPPKFTLLGSVRVLGSVTPGTDLSLISLKFVHGVLYCSTRSCVYAVFLGDLKDEETVCEMDIFTIATNSVPIYGIDNPDNSSPTPVITSLSNPHIMAYHSGGLLVSTSYGLRLLPLSHPLIRIGTLLAANLVERARKWIAAAPKPEHDALAHFLIRRGRADLAYSDLSGLSVETYIDLCMRYEQTSELENLLDEHGAAVIREICEWGRGDINGGYSAFLCIGVYMLGKGKIGCTKRLISRATSIGINKVLVDAMRLATMVVTIDREEGNSLLKQVMEKMEFDGNGGMPIAHIIN